MERKIESQQGNPEVRSPGAQDAGPPNIDTGLASLVMIAGVHGVAADSEQIRHAFAIGAEGAKTLDILRAAKELGFKVKAVSVR